MTCPRCHRYGRTRLIVVDGNRTVGLVASGQCVVGSVQARYPSVVAAEQIPRTVGPSYDDFVDGVTEFRSYREAADLVVDAMTTGVGGDRLCFAFIRPLDEALGACRKCRGGEKD